MQMDEEKSEFGRGVNRIASASAEDFEVEVESGAKIAQAEENFLSMQFSSFLMA